ncbi:class I SAM-dependent methyltransferase [Streptomyces sp. MP131-18]|uniref:class I SAM-dependent methyltransferase n=1 Tax=Streptomyces sp. MP131-18 TaxID=1857892 RepID=UPI0009A1DB02|nr:class I SAM-dependent methyltransferase [Streptomyces sp. MP131-18]ONK09331.1 dTDP-3-amino-3,4, 6-trideoxy-alpha-D-glucopyranose [Streptomyces sp. MP131-18]
MTVDPAVESMAYSREHADIYDMIHSGRGRDWAAEADSIADIAVAKRPGADSVLDVACGTGEHLRRFRERFTTVAGLELSAGMRELAQRKLPGVTIHAGDMRDFDLGQRFDVVTCMCFSLGYMTSVGQLHEAIASLVRHVNPGGVVIAEPWWFPEKFLDGFVSGAVTHERGHVISRVSHSVREGGRSRMTVRYTVANAQGIRDFTETEIHSLFSREEYLAGFARAGVEAEFQEGGPNGRGMFIGTRG